MFKKAFGSQGNVEYIVVGLGNPDRKYEGTKHNVGFMLMDVLAEKYGLKINKIKYKSVVCDTVIEGKRVLLMKPQTYMNNSGEAIREAAQFYKIPPQNIIVIFDDISLEPGKLRIRKNGSAGGHNGLKSIIYHLNSDQFPRIKIGVGAKPHPDYDLASWVLSGFSKENAEQVKSALDSAVSALEMMLKGQTDMAMNKFNQR
ncbi:MAG: aminoacyl-tRNA hydrolase [Clostridia bacterium]|nr:aminoacyl-tRNA hydrolase [Clostridia bacterium]